MSISRAEWADWLRSPVTQAVNQALTKRSESLIEDLLKIEAETLEAIGIRHIALRNRVEGLGEFLDLDSLADMVEVVDAT